MPCTVISKLKKSQKNWPKLWNHLMFQKILRKYHPRGKISIFPTIAEDYRAIRSRPKELCPVFPKNGHFWGKGGITFSGEFGLRCCLRCCRLNSPSFFRELEGWPLTSHQFRRGKGTIRGIPSWAAKPAKDTWERSEFEPVSENETDPSTPTSPLKSVPG